MDAYRDSLEHIRHELARIDLMLRRALIIARARLAGTEQDEFRGLVISDREIDSMTQALDMFGEPWRAAEVVRPEVAPVDAQIEALRVEIEARTAATHDAGRALRMVTLAAAFHLSQAEVDLLLLALAPELEPRYETLYAYLQNDVTRKRPSVDLALNVICRSAEEKVFARRFVADEGPLRRFAVLDLIEETYDRQPTLLRHFLRVRDSVVRMLLDQPASAPELGSWLPSEDASRDLSVASRERIRNLAASIGAGPSEPSAVYLSGRRDDAIIAATRLLGHELGRPLLSAALAQLESEPWPRIAALARDTLLHNALLVVTSAGVAKGGPAALRELVAMARPPVIVAGPASAAGALPQSILLWHVDVRPADYATRIEAWRAALDDHGIAADELRLADTFRFGGQRIRQTAALARSLAAVRDPANPRPAVADVLDAGRALTAPDLSRLAIPIEPRYSWDDLVLPDDKVKQLRGVASRIQHRRTVHRAWGFGAKLSRGKGVSVLFSGPSGTGKTMAAEVLAKDLGVDLYQVDLSSVVSKYIGETEKNLERIFTEAELSNQLLLFDEADAIFGKRTEVKDAHDRYANIEIDYLLQRMEQYSGPVVLATNFQKNLDEAFLRRLSEIVEFPFPDEAARERIWRGHFPDEAPREDDIDFVFLAAQFHLPGGNIRNIVVNAAFMAAQEGSSIGMRHVVAALRGEFQKQGKLVMKSELGRYGEPVPAGVA
jgi:hypothetical protein